MRWWRVFIDKLAGRSSDGPDIVGPRRRRATRYPFQVKLTLKCASWPHFVELFASDVSRGGVFVPTTEQADLGEATEVDLLLPDGTTLTMNGTVVSVLPKQGLGIRFDPLEGADRDRFEAILGAARAAQPRPEPSPVTASGSLDLESVRRAIGRSEAVSPAPPAPAARARRAPTSPGPGPIVGIDLGTTYTSIATVRGKKVTVLAREDGSRSTPSVIAFPTRDQIVVGAEARARIATDPAHTVVSPKRLLGRGFDEPEIQTFTSRVPYRTFAGPDGTTAVELWGHEYAIPQLCSFLFEDIRLLAERLLGEPITHAVVTVPISFDAPRTEALRRATTMAGLEIVAILDEPSAAALANRFDPDFGGVVGVYEFGGGTFDFSVVDVSSGDFQVLATAGDSWLGGDDFDQVLAEAAANQFWREHKVDLRNQAVEWQRLLFACEHAKRKLTDNPEALITVPEALRTASGMVDLELSIDRATFKRASSALVHRSLTTCGEALAGLGMKPSDLRTVYLSGGTTYIPPVREAVAQFFRVPIRTGVPPEHAVCLGAAIYAAQLQLGRPTTLTDG